MPFKIKVVFSIVVLVVAVAGYFFLQNLEQTFTPYLALFLGAFSVFPFWVFPEVSHKKK